MNNHISSKKLPALKKLKFKTCKHNLPLGYEKDNYLQIYINNNVYSFKISDTGNYIAVKNLLPSKNKLFEFSYRDKNISLYSDIFIFNFGIYKFIQLAKMYSLIEDKIYYKVYEEFKYYYTPSFLKSISYHFKKEEYLNFLIETQLGNFDNEEIDYNLDVLTSRFFEESRIFYTHVVGIKYYSDIFEFFEHKGDIVYLIWENENRYDQNAIVVLNEYGEKIGYIRKTISRYLVKKFRYTPVLKAKILEADDKSIYIEVNLGNS